MQESDPDHRLPSVRRPWYRLHRSTWFVGPLGLIVAVLLVVPGGIGSYPELDTWGNSPAIVHGWPLNYLWRVRPDWYPSGYDPTHASPTLPWNLGDSVWQFHPLALALDIIIAALAVLAFVAFVEWRRRKRVRFFQFSMRQLLVAVTVFGVALGWWSSQRTTDEQTAAFGRQGSRGLEPRVPFWLRSLVGDEPLLRFGLNEPRQGVAITWEPSNLADIRLLVDRFPDKYGISIRSAISPNEAAEILRLSRLKMVSCEWPAPADAPRLLNCLNALPSVHRLEVDFFSRPAGKLDDDGLQGIAGMSHLEWLLVLDAHRLTDRSLAKLRDLGSLKELELWGATVSMAGIARLADIRGLRRLRLKDSSIVEEGLSELARLDRLVDLDIGGSTLTDKGAEQLRALRNLRCLNIGWSRVSSTGLGAMLAPAPDAATPFPKLRVLTIQETGIRRGALHYLADLGALEELALETNQVDDAGIAVLQRLPKLHRVYVRQSANGDPGNYVWKTLPKALPDVDVVFQ
jgi:hypothetical protein